MSVTAFLSQCRFDEPMDHENAIRLLRTLVVRGCKSDEPMADAFVRAIALEIGLGNDDPAFAYAVKQGWLDESKKWGWTNLRRRVRQLQLRSGGAMPRHKFQIGQTVFLSPSFGLNMPGGAYIVTKKLPERDGEYVYQVKSANEPHQRIVRESEMSDVP